jgi:DNA-binding response OmpR family regulator
MKILAVDDDPIILELLPVALREQGHCEVTTALSGAIALDVLSRTKVTFDVLLLDISMPEMDGITLCRRIRELPAYTSTPIIMLTALSDTLTIESAFGVGANDYITKPFDVKGIGARIQVAERMMRNTPKTVMADPKADYTHDDSAIHHLHINDPLKINGLNQHTDMFSLGNYLSQLARNKVASTSVFAVQICEFETFFRTCSSRELIILFSEVAKAVSFSAENKRLLGAYRGSGTFVYIAPDDLNFFWPEIERRVEYYLKCPGTLDFLDIDKKPTVIASRPCRPNASKTSRVRPTFERALLLLEKRATTLPYEDSLYESLY